MRVWSWLVLLLVSTGRLSAQAKWEQMNYGPYLASSVTLPWAKNGEDLDGIVLKGLTFTFGTNGAACFDTGELRWAAVWTGGGLKLMGTPFDGTHRPPEKSRPAAVGTALFGTSHGPGWSQNGDWRDPRTEPYLPLPKEWAHWRGLHDAGGDQLILEYSVGDTAVRERPSLDTSPGATVFTRVLEIAPHRQPLALLVAELRLELRNQRATVGLAATPDQRIQPFGPLTAGADGLPSGARWEVIQGNRLMLHLPRDRETRSLRLSVTQATPETLARWMENAGAQLSALPATGRGKSSPPPTTFRSRFPDSITTRGIQGNTGGAYEVDSIPLPDTNPAHAWMRPSGFDFFREGDRAALCTWSGDVWIASGLQGSLDPVTWRRFATGLFQPQGLKIVKDQVYVLGRDQITRLLDLNQDGEADVYENFNNDVSITPNFHEFALDLQADAAGNFYFTKGGPLLGTDYWDPISAHNGCVLKVSADGRKLERYATGLRAPNGSGVGPHGEVTCSDNEGIWTPVCRLNWVKPGGFYGSLGLDHRTPAPTRTDPPLCWLPFAVDNSAGGQVWAGPQFGPLSGELIHLSYGKCRAFHVLSQDVDGIRQGGVVPLPWKFDSSAMRGRVHPQDGSLWVTGHKGWQTTATRDGALHRVRFTGKPFPTLTGFTVQPQAFELQFNTALNPAAASDPQNWNLQQWNYRWSHKYGSDLYSVAEPEKVLGKKGDLKGDAITIRSIQVLDQGRRVRIEVPEVVPAMQLMVRGTLRTADGAELPVEYYGSINAVPRLAKR